MRTLRDSFAGLIATSPLLATFALVASGIASIFVPDALTVPLDDGGTWATGLAIWCLGHCDGLDGPVVTVARNALATGNVNLVLPWVRADDEAEIRVAFERARVVRDASPAARELADTHFFETLVRLHRASEGETFTGLKPAGRDLGPAVPAADRALETGNADAVVSLVQKVVEHGIRERFARAHGARGFDPDDVEAGRKYVAAYVAFVHFVEQLHVLASGAPASHDHRTATLVAQGVHAHGRPDAAGAHHAH